MKSCAALRFAALALLKVILAQSTAPSSCPTPSTIPDFNDAALPNPFLFNNNTPVLTKTEWDCRRAQLAALIQGYEAGFLPPRPDNLTGTFTQSGNSGNLTITASNEGAVVSFSSIITYPGGTAPSTGWPLMIGFEGGSIPIPAGIATLNYENSAMAQQNDQSSRGVGTFYNLYGSNANASAMTAWTWGVSRIIDILEETPAARINTQRIGVTGCSRDGKGALMAGAFEPRIALTIPQESGSGGDAGWRISLFEQNNGAVVQTATEIVQENVWFSPVFDNYVDTLNVLPYDHHSLLAMVAPRGLIGYENTDYVWLSPVSSFGCQTGARAVYEALGVPENHGFEQIGGHLHCAWPANLTASLDAFINKFLLDQDVDTSNFFSSNMVFNGVLWNQTQWIDWAVPTLT
ncbi:carbohydrate esterase family 15 protein [Collybiopsis luxurians FD-317 M1]|uniref:(4-O-methyl)-D-glucuronate--lignin esterase n=1 Tax=Collybiopsis luxurians FD-317 M1 TaxID=944289 RepID=A0A0D0CV26_9AGAR|nr:carbohydrate esterase family 15 protein [Collybiopsis luxurians FD-317 M1]